MDALVHCVLDGQQWMTRGRSFDPLTAGRMVAWPNFQGVEPEGEIGVGNAAAHLAELDPARRDELLAFSARMKGRAAPATAPTGNRVFWASDYASQQRPAFFASCRLSSRRTYGTESGSGQNELGYHLGDGAMTLMITGEEYRDIYPLWDWRRVPGVTAVYTPTIPLPRHMWGKGSQGWSDFAGGVSDGAVGAAAMELRRGGLHARKSWFFLDDVVVCLGASIQPDDPTLPVVTSIDQRWAKGGIRTGEFATDPPSAKAGTLDGPGWVHHAGVSYLFPGAARVRFESTSKSAPWSVINHSAHGSMFRKRPLTEVEASGDVFSLWLDHGVGLYTPTTYAYMVVPGLAPEKIGAFNRTRAPQTLVNSGSIQAITRDGLVQAVFWQPGTLDLTDKRTLTVDRPGIIQLRQDPENRRWILAAGNPTHQPGPMRVRLSWLSKELVFDFPAGLYAGRPMTMELQED